MDVNQKSELICSWTPTSRKKKNAWIQAQESQDPRPPLLGLSALPFFSLFLPEVCLYSSDRFSLVKWCRLTETKSKLYHSDQKWGSEVKFTESESWREAGFLRWLIKEIFKQKDSWTVFTVCKQEILNHPDLKRRKLAALRRAQGGASSDQGHSYCQPWGLKQGSRGTLTSLFSCPWMT